MSLIHDALRKAAEEKTKSGRRPLNTAELPVAQAAPRRRSAWPILLALGLGLGVGLFLRLSSPSEKAQVSEGVQPTDPPRPTAIPTPAPEEGSAVEPPKEKTTTLAPERKGRVEPESSSPGSDLPPPARRDQPDEARPDQARQAVAGAASPSDSVPAPPPQVEPVGGSESAVMPTQVQAAPALPRMIQVPAQKGQIEPGTFVLEATVDGVRLELDFIVWSKEKPFAQINGRQVEVGQQVEGYLVIAIERHQVTLQSPSRTLNLRVR
jgi:hypothetical protein